MRAPWLRIAATLAALAAAGFGAPARADSYPAKPIAIIVPAAPGGVTDMLGRILAQRFIADWGARKRWSRTTLNISNRLPARPKT